MNLPFAGLAKLVEFIEAGDQLINLPVGRAPCGGDMIGHVFRRASNDWKMPAQILHIVERSCADGLDGVDPGAIVGDQAGQPVRMLRQPFGSNTAKRIDIARLRRDELPRQAELAVDCGQAGFKFGRFFA